MSVPPRADSSVRIFQRGIHKFRHRQQRLTLTQAETDERGLHWNGRNICELTDGDCVVDFEAAEHLVDISGMEETISSHHHLKRLWLQDTHWQFYILDSLQAKSHFRSFFGVLGRHDLQSAPGAIKLWMPSAITWLVMWLYLVLEWKIVGLAIVGCTYWDETELNMLIFSFKWYTFPLEEWK